MTESAHDCSTNSSSSSSWTGLVDQIPCLSWETAALTDRLGRLTRVTLIGILEHLPARSRPLSISSHRIICPTQNYLPRLRTQKRKLCNSFPGAGRSIQLKSGARDDPQRGVKVLVVRCVTSPTDAPKMVSVARPSLPQGTLPPWMGG
jgi:hypothetical protein